MPWSNAPPAPPAGSAASKSSSSSPTAPCSRPTPNPPGSPATAPSPPAGPAPSSTAQRPKTAQPASVHPDKVAHRNPPSQQPVPLNLAAQQAEPRDPAAPT